MRPPAGLIPDFCVCQSRNLIADALQGTDRHVCCFEVPPTKSITRLLQVVA